jgi:hypothetical protein
VPSLGTTCNSAGTGALTPQALAVASTVGLTMVSAQTRNPTTLDITYNEAVSCATPLVLPTSSSCTTRLVESSAARSRPAQRSVTC